MDVGRCCGDSQSFAKIDMCNAVVTYAMHPTGHPATAHVYEYLDKRDWPPGHREFTKGGWWSESPRWPSARGAKRRHEVLVCEHQFSDLVASTL